MYDRTITLFNYRESDKLWRTTLFKGVNVEEYATNSEEVRGNSLDEMADDSEIVQNKKEGSTEIILPCDRMMKAGKSQYISPREYQALESVDGFFTFTPEWDFIMTGDYHSDDPLDDTDHEEGLYHAMNAEHNNAYMISSVIWFSLLPHFEIDTKKPKAFPKLFRVYQYNTQTSDRGRERDRAWLLIGEKRCVLAVVRPDEQKRFSQIYKQKRYNQTSGDNITHTIFHVGPPVARENDVFSMIKNDVEVRFFRVKAVQNHSESNVFTTYYCEENDEMKVLTAHYSERGDDTNESQD